LEGSEARELAGRRYGESRFSRSASPLLLASSAASLAAFVVCAVVLVARVSRSWKSGKDTSLAKEAVGGSFTTPLISGQRTGILSPVWKLCHAHTFLNPNQLENIRSITSVSGLAHIIRAFGPYYLVVGRDEQCYYALDLVTNQRLAEAFFGRAIITRTRWGLRCRLLSGASQFPRARETHRDQLLAALAEAEVNWRLPVYSSAGKRLSRLEDLLVDSVLNFQLEQHELAWTSVAYALLLPPRRRWSNRYAEVYSFDDVVERLRRVPLRGRACAGTHVLYSLALLSAVDRQHSILSAHSREVLLQFLGEKLAICQETQRSDGSWDWSWWEQQARGSSVQRNNDYLKPREERLLVTGHMLEWMSLMPENLQPSYGTVRKATGWLHANLCEYQVRSERALCILSHGTSALVRLYATCTAAP